MSIDRRLFLGGIALAGLPDNARAAISAPGATPAQTTALAAIAAYLEAHRNHFALPAMGLVVVDGPFTAIIQSGTSDYLQKTPLAGREMWQIGSISKSFVALICLQLAAEAKLDLEADIRRYLPEAPLPDDGPFTIRALLDHTTGLPDFNPSFPADGSKLWRGFAAGMHWSYSNVAYDLLGTMIARLEGKVLAQVIEARIARPLGMADTRGAITWRDRDRYTASYSTLRPDRPVMQRNALAPAPWVDVNIGAGSVASTLPDMARYLRFLVAVGQSKGAPLLSDALAALWLAKPVAQDPAKLAETYGLGLMHRSDDGRALLHHTGGMVSFSSSFHVDAAAGTGAFASCAIGGTGYRPRLLTAYAAKVMRLAAAGKPIPPPPALGPPPADTPADYPGRYVSGGETLELAARGVTLAGITRPIETPAPDILLTDHPALADFPLVVVRTNGTVIAIDHGARRFVRGGVAAPLPPTPDRNAARAGHYQSDDPWLGGFTLVARGDTLFLGGTDPIIDIGNDIWRAAEPDWSPERISFGGFVAGRPQIAMLSGRVYERRDG
ncbi:MAG: serine hydrolase domain-containing protein [Polymorphobacter sp.]